MAEVPQPERNTSTQETSYQKYLASQAEKLLGTPEFKGVYNWFKERVAALPEMKVSKAPLTDGKNWKHTMTPEGQVEDIKSSFFSLEGRAIATPKQTWNQPGIFAEATTIDLPTPKGIQHLNVSGFVGILRDTKGNVLLSVAQEPYAQTIKKALIRTPFQTSVAKLQGLIGGKPELDPNLSEILKKVGGGKPVSDMFTSGEVQTFPLSSADANRMEATNIGFSMTIKDEETQKSLVSDGSNRWCSPTEAKVLIEAGLINGHTVAAISASAQPLAKAA